jgi:glutaredoxin-related protein
MLVALLQESEIQSYKVYSNWVTVNQLELKCTIVKIQLLVAAY